MLVAPLCWICVELSVVTERLCFITVFFCVVPVTRIAFRFTTGCCAGLCFAVGAAAAELPAGAAVLDDAVCADAVAKPPPPAKRVRTAIAIVVLFMLSP